MTTKCPLCENNLSHFEYEGLKNDTIPINLYSSIGTDLATLLKSRVDAALLGMSRALAESIYIDSPRFAGSPCYITTRFNPSRLPL